MVLLARRAIEAVPDGQDPNLTLAPYISLTQEASLAATSLVYRGHDSSRFIRHRIYGDSVWGYSLNLVDLASAAGRSLSSSTPIYSGITSFATLTARIGSDCPGIHAHFQLFFSGNRLKQADTDRRIATLPPSFFETPQDGASAIPPFVGATKLLRTSVFEAGDTATDVTLWVTGHDSLISWLNTQPYDSSLGRAADCGVVPTLMRDSDNTVLWQGDTIWARMAGDSMLWMNISIPVDTAADIDEEVYVQFIPIVTADLSYDTDGGFYFLDSLNVSEYLGRRAVPSPRATDASGKSMMLAVQVVPNPLRNDVGEIVLSIYGAGPVTVKVYNAQGQKMLDLGTFEPESAGEYRAPLDLQGLSTGMYSVVAEQGEIRVSTSVPVTR